MESKGVSIFTVLAILILDTLVKYRLHGWYKVVLTSSINKTQKVVSAVNKRPPNYKLNLEFLTFVILTIWKENNETCPKINPRELKLSPVNDKVIFSFLLHV